MQKIFFHKKILIAPLDWGLGHTTRCIPLIRYLLHVGCEIIVAGSDEQLLLLNQEFPKITTIKLKGYQVTYSKQKRWLPIKILLQVPKILLTIRKEHKWLQKKIKLLNIDLVISDNRFGLYTRQIPCVFITHQLTIKTKSNWLEDLVRSINYKYINRYMECWIPDFESREKNIAGELSHPGKHPLVPLRYIGPLSRFEYLEGAAKEYDYLFLISGPEPQRTILEHKIFKIAPQLRKHIAVVRGKPAETTTPNVENCMIINHLTTRELQDVMNRSEFIISRSGYTSVMEILSLKKKSILIATPGQTEQEYLAKHLMDQQWCYCFHQDQDILPHLQNANAFEFKFPSFDSGKLEVVVNEFLSKLN